MFYEWRRLIWFQIHRKVRGTSMGNFVMGAVGRQVEVTKRQISASCEQLELRRINNAQYVKAKTLRTEGWIHGNARVAIYLENYRDSRHR